MECLTVLWFPPSVQNMLVDGLLTILSLGVNVSVYMVPYDGLASLLFLLHVQSSSEVLQINLLHVVNLGRLHPDVY